MADQNDRGAARKQLCHTLFALFLKQKIAHGQNFVRNQNIRLGDGRHGKRQTRHHTGGIVFKRYIEEILQLAEFHNVVEFGVDVLGGVAQHGAVEVDIFACGQVHIKARAQLDQRGNGAVDGHLAGAGLVHAGNHLQQRAFAAAVQTDQPVKVAGHNVKADIVQGEKLVKADAAVQQCHKVFLQAFVAFFCKVKAHRNMVDGNNRLYLCHFCVSPYIYKTNLS